MARDFEKGSNQLPQSSIGKNKYPLRGKLDTGEEDTEHYSVVEIDEYDQEENVYTLKRPTEPNLPHQRCLFVPAPVEAEGYTSCGAAENNNPRWCRYDPTPSGFVPEIGDFVGTQEDSYNLRMYRFGFEVLAYDDSEEDAELVFVRPQNLMPTVVKAVSGEADGEVIVKFCDYQGNTEGDEFTVHTLSGDS